MYRKARSVSINLFLGVVVILAIAASLYAIFNDWNSHAKLKLENQGYKNVAITGNSYDWRCGRMMPYVNKNFTATNKDGAQVKGTYCGMMFMGTTFID